MKLGILRPHQRDLKFALGDLEAIVLRELWESKDPLSVKEFHLKISHTRPVAVTTVATILDRLYRKRIVLRKLVREGGPHYVYSPRLTENEFKLEVVDNVMSTLLHSFNDITVAYIANKMSENGENDRQLSKYLERLSRTRLKK
jgi:predicted transcriptional regulator